MRSDGEKNPRKKGTEKEQNYAGAKKRSYH